MRTQNLEPGKMRTLNLEPGKMRTLNLEPGKMRTLNLEPGKMRTLEPGTLNPEPGAIGTLNPVSVNVEPGRMVRWGLIGAGDIVRKRVGEALSERPRVRARGRQPWQGSTGSSDLLKEVGARRWHADWRDLVRDDEVDAVYVATPVYLHAQQTIAAAEAGKHILCEKPMAMNVAECDRMIAACRAARRAGSAVAYYRHYYPAVIRIRS